MFGRTVSELFSFLDLRVNRMENSVLFADLDVDGGLGRCGIC